MRTDVIPLGSITCFRDILRICDPKLQDVIPPGSIACTCYLRRVYDAAL
jgi:hypothetical protein